MAKTPIADGKTDSVELTPTEARQAIITGHMRYVLGISLALAVLLMAFVLIG